MLGKLFNRIERNLEAGKERQRQRGRLQYHQMWKDWNNRRIYQERLSSSVVEPPPPTPRYIDPGTCLFDYGRMEREENLRLEGRDEVDLVWRFWNVRRLEGENEPEPELIQVS